MGNRPELYFRHSVRISDKLSGTLIEIIRDFPQLVETRVTIYFEIIFQFYNFINVMLGILFQVNWILCVPYLQSS
jgi:hypothetical protein